jgi:hypothetical protein
MSFRELLLKILLPNTPVFLKQPKHEVVCAFIIGGKPVYQYTDPFNVPYRRGLKALAAYEEFESRVNRKYLLEHKEAMKTVLQNPKQINMGDVFRLYHQLEERLNFVIEPDLMWKLAAVVFFETEENPYDYDFAYGLKKIERWKKESTMRDFFLQQPLLTLIPYLRDYVNDIQIYSQVAELIKTKHSETLSSIQSKKTSTGSSGKN